MLKNDIKTTVPVEFSKEDLTVIAEKLKEVWGDFNLEASNYIYKVRMVDDDKVRLYIHNKDEMSQTQLIAEHLPEIFNSFLTRTQARILGVKGTPPFPLKYNFEEQNPELGFRLKMEFEWGTPGGADDEVSEETREEKE